MTEAIARGLVLRPMVDEDLPFTAALYASTRLEELAVTGWSPEMMHVFLSQQHAAQHLHYQKHYQGMEAMIVEHEGAAIGRLYLFASPSELRIVDIALLPEGRGQGFGSAMLADLLRDATAQGRRVTIHVEKNNPARSLYTRVGFRVIDEDRGAYDLWEWRPAAAQ